MSKENLLFSIVIPSYNRANLIVETIHSVTEQTYFNFELIIVDDGSTDNTSVVVKPFLLDTRIKYFKISNSERGASRNYGTFKSAGDYITFLDSDDVFLPWHLSRAFEIATRNDYPPVFHLGYEMLHSNGHVVSLPVLPNPVNEKLLEGNFLSCMGVFLRADVAFGNLFNEDRALSGSEDYELWLRVAARYPILVYPGISCRLIDHEARSVITTNPKTLLRRIAVLNEKLKQDTPFMRVFGNQLDRLSAFISLYLALHLALSGERLLALKSLTVSVKMYPRVIVTYRFIVALKKIALW